MECSTLQRGRKMKRLKAAFFVLCSTGILATASAAGLTVTAKSGVSATCTAVMWITNAANVIQHTFAIWDKGDDDHLKVWRTYSGGTISTDAVSSATLSANATFSGTWNLKDANGAQVPNGTYKYFIEICQNGPTPYHVVGSIVIDATSKTQTAIDSGNTTTALTNVTAVYTAPATTNHPPVITNTDTVTAKVGSTTTWTATATDADGDPVTFTFTGQQSWITVSGATLTMNPLATSKNDTVSVLASDGKGGLDTLKLKITVVNPPPVNSPPVITNPDTVTARIGAATTWTAVATDPNGDPVTFTFTGQQAWITVSGATLTMNPTATSKNDTVRVLASDGKGGFDTLNLKVTPFTPPTTNVPPVITNPDTQSARIGVTTTWTALATDANGDAVTFTFTGQQAWITVSGATLTMNPTATSKNDTVRVLASDGKGGLDTLNLKITVPALPPTNSPPVIISADTVTAKIGSTTRWTAFATDANGDNVTFTFTGQQSWITVNAATLIMNPTASSRNDTVRILAADGKGGFDTMNLKIAVPVVNYPPKITSAAIVNAQIGSITKWVAAATDPNSDSVTFSFEGLPITATAWYSYSYDTLIIIPDASSQSCTTTVIASDGRGGTDTLRLRINVLPAQSVLSRNDVRTNFTITVGNMPFSFPVNGDRIVTVALFSCNGARIMNRAVTLGGDNATSISFPKVSKGIYFLRVNFNGVATARKVIIGP
jgi:RNase P/RNase MRP subunit p29